MLSLWSADCVEHVVNNFTAVSDEDRRQKAIEIARQWSRGEIKVGVAQKAAVATADFAEHSLGGDNYAIKAVAALGNSKHDERIWQLQQLPREIRELVPCALSQV
jgi:hypothetical protein